MRTDKEILAYKLFTSNKAITTSMTNIKAYSRDNTELSRYVYQPIMDNINAHFELFENINQTMNDSDKSEFYRHLFNSYSSKPLELLFCAQNFDPDLLLAAARRANHCEQAHVQRELFLCDMRMCKEFVNLGLSIENVANVGILHHYIPVDIDKVLNNSQIFIDEEVKKAIKDVIDFIPDFINDCISNHNGDLKVVLRSCYGVETKDEMLIPELMEVKAYPIAIDLSNANAETVHSKERIVIQQNVLNDKIYKTLLFLPTYPHPVQLDGFPKLDSPENFQLFAQKLIDFWPKLKSNTTHVNPYSIHFHPMTPPGKLISSVHNLGIKTFRNVFTQKLLEWEEGITKLKSEKSKYNCLFSTTASLIDVTPIPENSYAGILLDSIKTCSYLSSFKAYYADYRAGPDRTILEIDGKGKNASSPKAVIVSRHTMWGTNKFENTNSNTNFIKPHKNSDDKYSDDKYSEPEFKF